MSMKMSSRKMSDRNFVEYSYFGCKGTSKFVSASEVGKGKYYFTHTTYGTETLFL